MAKIDLKNCTIKIKDGGANSITVKIGEGTMSWSESKPREYVKEMGRLGSVRNGDEEPIDVNLDCVYDYITVDTGITPTFEDVLKKIGLASAWVTTSSGACEPYALDVVVTNDVPCDDVANEVTTLTEFRYEKLDHDIKAGTIKLSGKAMTVSSGRMSVNIVSVAIHAGSFLRVTFDQNVTTDGSAWTSLSANVDSAAVPSDIVGGAATQISPKVIDVAIGGPYDNVNSWTLASVPAGLTLPAGRVLVTPISG